jgi:hypothetical protein
MDALDESASFARASAPGPNRRAHASTTGRATRLEPQRPGKKSKAALAAQDALVTCAWGRIANSLPKADQSSIKPASDQPGKERHGQTQESAQFSTNKFVWYAVWRTAEFGFATTGTEALRPSVTPEPTGMPYVEHAESGPAWHANSILGLLTRGQVFLAAPTRASAAHAAVTASVPGHDRAADVA